MTGESGDAHDGRADVLGALKSGMLGGEVDNSLSSCWEISPLLCWMV